MILSALVRVLGIGGQTSSPSIRTGGD